MEDISCTGGCILQGGFLQCSGGFTYSPAEDIFCSGGYILHWRISAEDIFCIGGFLQRIYISEEAIFCNGRYILQWRISAVDGYVFQPKIYSAVKDFCSVGYIL